MSIAEFSQALQNRAVSQWFIKENNYRDSTKLSNVNVITNPTGLYRDEEQTIDKTAFILSKSTLLDMVIKFKPNISNPTVEADRLFEILKNKSKTSRTNRKELPIMVRTKDNTGKVISSASVDSMVYFPKIGFSGITNILNDLLDIKGDTLSKEYEKGHVFSLATRLMEKTQKRLSASLRSTISSESTSTQDKASTISELITLEKTYNNLLDYYNRLDRNSANIKNTSINTDVEIYANYDKKIDRKGNNKYLVEMQLKSVNQRSADEVREGLKYIRKIFSPSTASAGPAAILKEIDKLLGTFNKQGVATNIVTDEVFRKQLIDLKGSPSFTNMILNSIVNSAKGNNLDQRYVVPVKKVGTNKQTQIVQIDPKLLKLYRNDNKSKIAELKKTVSNIRKAKIVAQKPLATTNLTSLQNLINANLQNVISANMGDGSSKNILNYRTGRFAASASVERMSESRAGMITAFYTYMKNPYQTFEPGYAQGKPASRDPKLLISKSIREIAALKVGNRLRAVSI